ncbi:hypothetical protein [Corallococcus sp. CA047B]|uniref:hypothetical protein n=1 Tax=Corallococcus sp. CA047B TaxID=2316729 RepID=UPI0011C45B41|nr:hypothetical protein [Corallococcus sp. CA047B]
MLRVDLSASPDEEWRAWFGRGLNVHFSSDMEANPPSVEGSSIIMSAPQGREDEYVKHINDRIESTNALYEQQELPRLQAQQRRQEEQRRADEESERLLLEARERLKKLK